jgi:putative membrane protein
MRRHLNSARAAFSATCGAVSEQPGSALGEPEQAWNTADRNGAVESTSCKPMKKLLLLTTVLSLAASGVGLAQGDALNREDKEFLKNASEMNAAEVAVGKLAQEKGGPEVKKAGAMLVEDHTKAQDELSALTKKKNVELEMEPTSAQKKLVATLEKQEGEKFDKAFHESQSKSHKKAIKMFEDAAKDAKDADVKAYATKQLPGLQKHLEMLSGGKHDKH